MANSDFLRQNKNQHSIKNSISKVMDSDVDLAVQKMIVILKKQYPDLTFEHSKKLSLSKIISDLSSQYPQYEKDFSKVMGESFIKPDGGFLYATDKKGNTKLILVAEVKHQGTNDKRATEGLPKQAKGNAIERLGKNLTGVRAIFKAESMIPFVCFGSGHDFQDGSTILDRVVTMNDFFPLNKIFIEKTHLPFEPVSMFFRYEDWSTVEMTEIMTGVADEAIKYHFR
ncbi:restriction endonuclease [Candidatus Uhrbacteria bacterium CG_4_9_14_0_2_um_filter_41_50]|uniref:Restriction endonuclease n=1 Tax=Candidatus Uhrbacteria bacterium CG_4_9_14_0_2_um_filter_41_50 TaxID=1975031 RepID=A0A2M8ENR5_9BACT|nr:MAG: restriction endonuclease [Candidatus Uhrbacteria bacterium CG_4_9_14_0_2_um_filter_41_50]